jgi:hypothetical protein
MVNYATISTVLQFYGNVCAGHKRRKDDNNAGRAMS